MADTKGGISRKGQELDCAHHGSELIISELTGAEALPLTNRSALQNELVVSLVNQPYITKCRDI